VTNIINIIIAVISVLGQQVKTPKLRAATMVGFTVHMWHVFG